MHKDFPPVQGGFYPDPNHLYKIGSCLDASKCLTVKDEPMGVHHVMIDQYHKNDHQTFKIAMTNGKYVIKSAIGAVLNAVDGGDLRFTQEKHQPGEMFEIIPSNDGFATFIVKGANGTVLDVRGASSKVHTPVGLYKLHGNPNQKWTFLPA